MKSIITAISTKADEEIEDAGKKISAIFPISRARFNSAQIVEEVNDMIHTWGNEPCYIGMNIGEPLICR